MSKLYSENIDKIFELLETSQEGLSELTVKKRKEEFGLNKLPSPEPTPIVVIFLRQFLNPFIYILLFAALISLFLDHYSDFIFILLVLLLNAFIGTSQEYKADRNSLALQKISTEYSYVIRGGLRQRINTEELVPGDIVYLESGFKIPADLRLVTSFDLKINESLLTGESATVSKTSDIKLPEDTLLADRKNMGYAGTFVDSGRATGIVVTTGVDTELGKIAESIATKNIPKTPLMIRMEEFTLSISYGLFILLVLMGILLYYQGYEISSILILAIALSVSAIPGGLPVALTVALSIASSRMAKRNVIVRKLTAVEALGSCTFIATDKTGTLTVNEITSKKVVLPNQDPWEITGSGKDGKGEFILPTDIPPEDAYSMIVKLCISSILANEASCQEIDGEQHYLGDSVDIAFLVMAKKMGIKAEIIKKDFKEDSFIAFESQNQFSASLNRNKDQRMISVKGAFEKVLKMCDKMQTLDGIVPIDTKPLEDQVTQLANQGYRILAIARGENEKALGNLHEKDLNGLCFLGLVAMIDPLRPEAKEAIDSCVNAGIQVAMITGDHPETALTIAKELGIAKDRNSLVTGRELKDAQTAAEFNKLVLRARVFARIEPKQKLEIVQSLQNHGHYVAVTGDGANDAPALKVAHVGVAMGKCGTDVARDTSDIILTDDKFSSIVAGIEEGRIAYNNLRKVIYLLISTGLAEILLFVLCIILKLPAPLTAVQLLWLNLVTNGIQDVALAFEPAEGNELKKTPRPPKESIFNRLMFERILLSSLVMGGFAFYVYKSLIENSTDYFAAQNLVLLLMVLFENIMIGNCRSETKSAFAINPFSNRLLLIGALFAQGIHILTMNSHWFAPILGVQPVSLVDWFFMLAISLSVIVVMEIYKLARREA